MTTPFAERLRTRIPSWRHFILRMRRNPRQAVYDLLPLFPTPAARDRLARLAAMMRPKTRGFRPSEAARHWHDALVTDGIALDLPPVDAAVTAEMRQYFERTPCHDPYRPHLGTFRFDAPASPETNMGYFRPEEILRAPHVLELLNDPAVLETAERYLGCKPLLDNIGAWWAFGGRSAAKGTQRYHRDFDSLKGFKLFIYLTDVDVGSGPHIFMKTSHRSARLDTGKAQTDEAVRRCFGAANEVAVTGPAGTRFIADTFGFHKGALPGVGRRLLIAAQYNVNASPHLPRSPVLAVLPPRLDPAVNRLLVR
jgi:hypothetical protein